MTDQVVALIYVATIIMAGCILVVMLVTGAYFSQTVGVPLSVFGFLLSIANLTGLLYSDNYGWHMAIPGMILLLFFVFLFVASLGGEK